MDGMGEKRGGTWKEGDKGIGGVWCSVTEKQRKMRELGLVYLEKIEVITAS